MRYYLEFIFLENFLVNYIILFQVKYFTKQNNKKILILISCFIISLYTTIIVIYKISNISLKILEIIFGIYIAFIPKDIKTYIKILMYYILFNYMFLAIVIAITIFLNINAENLFIRIVLYCISGIILYILNNFLWKMWKTNIKKEKLTYTINIKGQEIEAFVDTGNMVRNFEHNLDVIFIDKKYYEILKSKHVLDKKIDIGVNTVTLNKKIDGYIVENVKIYKNKNKVFKIKRIIISFSEQSINIEGKYRALIGYNTYLENLEGVKL